MKDLLTSRRFWAAMVGVALVLMGNIWPDLKLDGEAMIAALVVIASYMLGVSVDPGPGGLQGILLSRKFWAALVSLVFIITRGLGINLIVSEEQLVEMALVAASFIASVAFQRPRTVSYGRSD